MVPLVGSATHMRLIWISKICIITINQLLIIWRGALRVLCGALTLRGVLEACFGPWNRPSVFGLIKCHEALAEWHFCAQIRKGNSRAQNRPSNTPSYINPPPKNHNAQPHIINSAIGNFMPMRTHAKI